MSTPLNCLSNISDTASSDDLQCHLLPQNFLQHISRKLNLTVFTSCDRIDTKPTVSNSHIFLEMDKKATSGTGLVPWPKFK